MIKAIFGALVGVAIALEIDRFIEERKDRYTPRAVTGRFFDTLNRRLEQSRARKVAAPGRGGPGP
jgi:cobalamin biosynthesis protein CobD/CbiB